ncbi:PEP-CTERM sorting domain-containing protein [Singulisphaera sp. Ch08]|uniref:PEP-CTERM sorting domain-containing protein n=1 Tax=Singulisphaera sp. Ch08 TaxID=3120278 RepID=A0AAU7CKB7_9BACT
MNRSRPLYTLVLMFATVTTAQASPVSYDFSGTFDQPVNGSTQFSGTFSYDTDLESATGLPTTEIGFYKDAPGQAGTLISMSFTVGNMTSSSLGPIVGSSLTVSHVAQYDMFNLNVAFKPGYHTIWQSIYITRDNTPDAGPGPFTSGQPPTSLSLSDFGGASFFFTSPDQPDRYADLGKVTSLTPAVPEPSTLAVLLIGFGGVVIRKRIARKRAGGIEAAA